MRMMRLADLSCGWTTLRLMMLPPTLAVAPRKETVAMKAMVRENMASQEEGQKSWTASSLCWAAVSPGCVWWSLSHQGGELGSVSVSSTVVEMLSNYNCSSQLWCGGVTSPHRRLNSEV